MAKALPKNIIILALLSLGMVETLSLEPTFAQTVPRRLEGEISFPKELHSPEIKFTLQPTGNRQFKIILDQQSEQLTNVKVFDILGNLILEDKIRPEDGLQKNYDFSSINSQLFVVEVGNAKYNKTKSIYANPQGHRSFPGAGSED